MSFMGWLSGGLHKPGFDERGHDVTYGASARVNVSGLGD